VTGDFRYDERDRSACLAVRDRPAALRDHLRNGRALGAHGDPRFDAFLRLVDNTPELREHARARWLRHEAALAIVIAESSGLPTDDPTCVALAHFALNRRPWCAVKVAAPPWIGSSTCDWPRACRVQAIARQDGTVSAAGRWR
jgi:hypothetical protein